MRGIHYGIKLEPIFSPKCLTGTAPLLGAVIDRQGFNALELVVAIGAITDSECDATLILMHGNQPDMSDGAESHKKEWLMDPCGLKISHKHRHTIRSMGYIGPKRYIQLSLVTERNDETIDIAAHAIFANAASSPIR